MQPASAAAARGAVLANSASLQNLLRSFSPEYYASGVSQPLSPLASLALVLKRSLYSGSQPLPLAADDCATPSRRDPSPRVTAAGSSSLSSPVLPSSSTPRHQLPSAACGFTTSAAQQLGGSLVTSAAAPDYAFIEGGSTLVRYGSRDAFKALNVVDVQRPWPTQGSVGQPSSTHLLVPLAHSPVVQDIKGLVQGQLKEQGPQQVLLQKLEAGYGTALKDASAAAPGTTSAPPWSTPGRHASTPPAVWKKPVPGLEPLEEVVVTDPTALISNRLVASDSASWHSRHMQDAQGVPGHWDQPLPKGVDLELFQKQLDLERRGRYGLGSVRGWKAGGGTRAEAYLCAYMHFMCRHTHAAWW